MVPRGAAGAGRITAAGMRKEVTFEPVEGPINDLIDDVYRAKYRGSALTRCVGDEIAASNKGSGLFPISYPRICNDHN